MARAPRARREAEGYGVGFLFALSSENRQRLGDLAAHTLVVRA